MRRHGLVQVETEPPPPLRVLTPAAAIPSRCSSVAAAGQASIATELWRGGGRRLAAEKRGADQPTGGRGAMPRRTAGGAMRFHTGMERPRLLLVPQVCALDWQIAPRLAEWAAVATFDAPGVGDEPSAGGLVREEIARRGLEQLDRIGWERCVVVADEFAVPTALLLARMRPVAVAGLALGHACLSHDVEGDRPPVNGGVLDALVQITQ